MTASDNVRVISGPDLFEPPCDHGGDGYCGYEGFDVAVEAGGDAAPVIEAAEHALNDVALSVRFTGPPLSAVAVTNPRLGNLLDPMLEAGRIVSSVSAPPDLPRVISSSCD